MARQSRIEALTNELNQLLHEQLNSRFNRADSARRWKRMVQLLEDGADPTAYHFKSTVSGLDYLITANHRRNYPENIDFCNRMIPVLINGYGSYRGIDPLRYFTVETRKGYAEFRGEFRAMFSLAITNHDLNTLQTQLAWIDKIPANTGLKNASDGKPLTGDGLRNMLLDLKHPPYSKAYGLMEHALERKFYKGAALLARHPNFDVLADASTEKNYFKQAVRANSVELMDAIRQRMETRRPDGSFAYTPRQRQTMFRGALFEAIRWNDKGSTDAAIQYLMSPDFKDPATAAPYIDFNETSQIRIKDITDNYSHTAMTPEERNLGPVGYAFARGNETLAEQLAQHPEIKRNPQIYSEALRQHLLRQNLLRGFGHVANYPLAESYFRQLLSVPPKLAPNLAYAEGLAYLGLGKEYAINLKALEDAFEQDAAKAITSEQEGKLLQIPPLNQPVAYYHYLHFLLKANTMASILDPAHLKKSLNGGVPYVSPIFRSLMLRHANLKWSDRSRQLLPLDFEKLSDLRDPIRQMVTDLLLPDLVQHLPPELRQQVSNDDVSRMTDSLMPRFAHIVTQGKTLRQLVELSDLWHRNQGQITNATRETMDVRGWASIFNIAGDMPGFSRRIAADGSTVLVLTAPPKLAGYQIVDMTNPEAVKNESNCTKHCFDGPSYMNWAQNGRANFISLRDPEGRPIGDMEVNILHRSQTDNRDMLYGRKVPIAGSEYVLIIPEFRGPTRNSNIPAAGSPARQVEDVFAAMISAGQLPIRTQGLGSITSSGIQVSALEKATGLYAHNMTDARRNLTFSIYSGFQMYSDVGGPSYYVLRSNDGVTYLKDFASFQDFMQRSGLRDAVWATYNQITGSRFVPNFSTRQNLLPPHPPDRGGSGNGGSGNGGVGGNGSGTPPQIPQPQQQQQGRAGGSAAPPPQGGAPGAVQASGQQGALILWARNIAAEIDPRLKLAPGQEPSIRAAIEGGAARGPAPRGLEIFAFDEAGNRIRAHIAPPGAVETYTPPASYDMAYRRGMRIEMKPTTMNGLMMGAQALDQLLHIYGNEQERARQMPILKNHRESAVATMRREITEAANSRRMPKEQVGRLWNAAQDLQEIANEVFTWWGGNNMQAGHRVPGLLRAYEIIEKNPELKAAMENGKFWISPQFYFLIQLEHAIHGRKAEFEQQLNQQMGSLNNEMERFALAFNAASRQPMSWEAATQLAAAAEQIGRNLQKAKDQGAWGIAMAFAEVDPKRPYEEQRNAAQLGGTLQRIERSAGSIAATARAMRALIDKHTLTSEAAPGNNPVGPPSANTNRLAYNDTTAQPEHGFTPTPIKTAANGNAPTAVNPNAKKTERV